MTHAPAPAPAPTAPRDDQDVWDWIRPAVIVASVLLPLLVALLTFLVDGLETSARLTGLGLAAAFGLWSVATMRKVHEDDDQQNLGWSLAYLTVAYLLFAALVLIHPLYFFLLFVLFWRAFSCLPLPFAIGMAVILVIITALLQVEGNEGRADVGGVLMSAGVSLVFAVLTGVFISRVIDQSKDRKTLIDELQAARAELATVSHDAGVMAERERMAHEIHDTLAQGFTSIVMLLQAADVALGSDADVARQHVRSAERTARDNLAEARNLVEGMLPAPLTDGTLVAALARLADRAGADLGIEAGFEVHGHERPLAAAQEVALLRVAQEAVANVRKHARPTAIRIVVDYGTDADAAVVLEVVDDGVGFDPASVEPGIGLPGMRRRLGAAGGDLTIASSPGQGTSIQVVLA